MIQSPDSLMLRAENLTKIFRSGEEEVVVLEDLNFEIHRGELVALVGASGSGKAPCCTCLRLWTRLRGVMYTAWVSGRASSRRRSGPFIGIRGWVSYGRCITSS